MEDYNYSSFPITMSEQEFNEFAGLHKAGEKAPDGELVNASNGSQVKLSDYWGKGPVMIEFGSIT